MNPKSPFSLTAGMTAAALLAIAWGTTSRSARADSLPGEILKFQQEPLLGAANAPFPGHDEISTATPTAFDNQLNPIAWSGTYMADDFADKFSTPIVHLTWWGSYQQNFRGEFGVQQFLVSIESDVPAVPGQLASHPGQPLLSQVVSLGPLAPGSGTFTETPVTSPPVGETVYKYNAELNLGATFPEKENTVYWLKIVALVNPRQNGEILWGWHNRDYTQPDPLASTAPSVAPGESLLGSVPVAGATLPVYHFQDDAVQGALTMTTPAAGGPPIVQQTSFTPQNYVPGLDGPDLIGQFSKDLAFELYTVPEPASSLLLALGAAALIRRPRHRRSSAAC